jgi:hypothetical protein
MFPAVSLGLPSSQQMDGAEDRQYSHQDADQKQGVVDLDAAPLRIIQHQYE